MIRSCSFTNLGSNTHRYETVAGAVKDRRHRQHKGDKRVVSHGKLIDREALVVAVEDGEANVAKRRHDDAPDNVRLAMTLHDMGRRNRESIFAMQTC